MSYLVKFFKHLSGRFSELIALLLLILVRSYQLLLSSHMGGNCRFQPSCSHFATECLQKHTPSNAVRLIFSRIIKCHPWGPFGYDPVPEVSNESAK